MIVTLLVAAIQFVFVEKPGMDVRRLYKNKYLNAQARDETK